MAKNYVKPGGSVVFTASSDITSGSPVVMGDNVGIAASDIANGETGTVYVEGVWKVAKAAGTAWGVGDKLDYDADPGAFDIGITPASGDVTGCAMAAAPAAADATTGLVKLTPGTGSAA